MSTIRVDILKKNIPFYDNLIQVEKLMGAKVYIVGGALRDLYLNKEIKDVDLTVENVDYGEFAIEFCKNIKTKPIAFKDNYRICKKGFELDISVLRGSNIFEDTSLRDFTINNIAVTLDGKTVINNDEDIKNKVIKAVYSGTFDADPVRIVRAFRFASTLNFHIDKTTLNLINEKKDLLENVAKERILAEIKKMFDGINLEYSLNLIVELDVFNKFLDIKQTDLKSVCTFINTPYTAIEEILKDNIDNENFLNKFKGIINENIDFSLKFSLFVDDIDFINFLGLSTKELKESLYYKTLNYDNLKNLFNDNNEKELKRFIFFNKDMILKAAIYILYKYKDSELFIKLITLLKSMDFNAAKLINGGYLGKIGMKPSPLYKNIINEVSFLLSIGELNIDNMKDFILNNFS